MNSIQNFLRANTAPKSGRIRAVVPSIPGLIPHRTIPLTPVTGSPLTGVTSWTKSSSLPSRSTFQNHQDWLANVSKSPNVSLDSFPVKKDDIKGVHSAAYNHLYRLKMPPVLLLNSYFSLVYFPVQHYISLLRKTNVALMFTLKGGVKLNDSSAEEALRRYRGRYRGHPFIQQGRFPMDSACRRSKYRKYIRQFMVDALDDVKTHTRAADVAGVYFFRFKLFPSSGAELRQVKKDVLVAFQKVLNDDEFNRKLLEHCQISNGVNYRDLVRTCQKQQHQFQSPIFDGERFPFTRDSNKLVAATENNIPGVKKASKRNKTKSKSKAKPKKNGESS